MAQRHKPQAPGDVNVVAPAQLKWRPAESSPTTERRPAPHDATRLQKFFEPTPIKSTLCSTPSRVVPSRMGSRRQTYSRGITKTGGFRVLRQGSSLLVILVCASLLISGSSPGGGIPSRQMLTRVLGSQTETVAGAAMFLTRPATSYERAKRR